MYIRPSAKVLSLIFFNRYLKLQLNINDELPTNINLFSENLVDLFIYFIIFKAQLSAHINKLLYFQFLSITFTKLQCTRK